MPDEYLERHPSVAEKLNFFECGHLPEPLFTVSNLVRIMAHEMFNIIEDDPQLALGLQKLIEAKDCFVRAKLVEVNKARGARLGAPIQHDDIEDPEV